MRMILVMVTLVLSCPVAYFLGRDIINSLWRTEKESDEPES